jgi:hypothetical protein
MPPLRGLCSIPFGALYSRDVGNLLIAGRHISATHIAFGSTRLQATTAVMGQAVGTAAALCLERDLSPRQLRASCVAELQQQLLKDDCYIIGLPSTDAGDLLLHRTARASSVAPLEVTDLDEWLPLDVGRGQMIFLGQDHVDTVWLLVRSTLPQAVQLDASLVPARTLDDFAEIDAVSVASAQLEPFFNGWLDFRFDAPVDRSRPYWVRIQPMEGLEWAYSPIEEIGAQRAEWYDILDRWQPVRGSHAFRVCPAARPFGADNVVNGVARPEVGPNLWISDSASPFPQWVEIDLPEPAWADRIRVTFDTNLSDLVDSGGAPECVRDYRVEVEVDGACLEVARVTGNYQRRRVHDFEPCRISKVRLAVDASNGAPQARVYEIRASRENS